MSVNLPPEQQDPSQVQQQEQVQQQQDQSTSQTPSAPSSQKTQAPIQLNIEKSKAHGKPAVDIRFKFQDSRGNVTHLPITFYFHKINGQPIDKLLEQFKLGNPHLKGQELKDKFVGAMIEKYSPKIARASNKLRQSIKDKHGTNATAILQEVQGKVFSVAKSQGWFDKGLTLTSYKTSGKNEEGQIKYNLSSREKVKSWRSRQAYNITHGRAFGWIRRRLSKKSKDTIWVVNEHGKVEEKELPKARSFSKTVHINETALRLMQQWQRSGTLSIEVEEEDENSTTQTGTRIELRIEEEEIEEEEVNITPYEKEGNREVLKNEIMAKINAAETFKSKGLVNSEHLQRIDNCEKELAEKFKELEKTCTKREIQILFHKELKNKKMRQQLQRYAPNDMNKDHTFINPLTQIRNKNPNLDLQGRLRDDLEYEDYEMEEKT